MSEFYGRLQGNRGQVTRGGSRNSGVTATVESWTTVVRTSHAELGNGERIVTIGIEGKYGGPALSLALDADRFYEVSEDHEVRLAACAVQAAMDELDAASKRAHERNSVVLREVA